MFIRDLATLAPHVVKMLPSYVITPGITMLFVDEIASNTRRCVGSIEITLAGYVLRVPRSAHTGTYTDVESLLVALDTLFNH